MSKYLCLSYSPKKARLYEQYEALADELIGYAKERGEIQWGSCAGELAIKYPRFAHDEHPDDWYEAVFDTSFAEFEDMRKQCAERYVRLLRRPWKIKERRKALEAYIRLDAFATRASGLSTSWY